jgi:hypothetical protein
MLILINACEKLNQEQAVQFTKRIRNAWSVAKSHITLAQKERNINKHRRPVDFKPSNKV